MLQKFKTKFVQKFDRTYILQRVKATVISAWILATGFWADDKQWIDSDTWND